MVFLGFLTPNSDEVLDCKFLNRGTVIYVVFGVLMIGWSILDVWVFSFYPLQINIFLN